MSSPRSWTEKMRFSILDVASPNAVMLDPQIASVVLLAVTGFFAYEVSLFRRLGINL